MPMDETRINGIRGGDREGGGENNIQQTNTSATIRKSDGGETNENRRNRLCKNNNCGRSFSPNTKSQTYCSNKCRLVDFRKRTNKQDEKTATDIQERLPKTIQGNSECETYSYGGKVETNERFCVTETKKETETNMYSQETLNLILSEREARHSAELEKVRAQLKLEALVSVLYQDSAIPKDRKVFSGFSRITKSVHGDSAPTKRSGFRSSL